MKRDQADSLQDAVEDLKRTLDDAQAWFSLQGEEWQLDHPEFKEHLAGQRKKLLNFQKLAGTQNP